MSVQKSKDKNNPYPGCRTQIRSSCSRCDGLRKDKKAAADLSAQPADRKFFQKNIESDNNKELRECLWTARYGKRKPKKDLFIGYLMEMKYISESGSTDVGGAKRKQLCKIINNLCIDNYEILSEEQRGILKNELKNTFKKFIQVSRGGRGFTSAVFGLGQLSDEGIAKKIAEQISNIAFLTPHMFRMDKEFKNPSGSSAGSL